MEPFGQKMESSGAQTAPPRLILVGGGVKSGKSAFALRLAADLAACGGGPTAPKVFIATGYAGDDEMARRIARHRQERGEAFTTLELPPKQPRTLPEILAGLDQTLPGNAKPTVAVVDCLTLWLSALLLEGESADAIALHVERLAAAAERRRGATVVVTNEVGMGVVPES
ncbi:MAG: bifunctional adenosylcobinamide kinase/adenosylcobinamide-phosphate guanylyltransferase, partial [Deltaproteobacteria bacterium]|nr:bifunctional adenosylcobinamide kinase/adenosylcobinamide-phosphate guanylyltransferase [Deltaproteobacteria bacterium]